MIKLMLGMLLFSAMTSEVEAKELEESKNTIEVVEQHNSNNQIFNRLNMHRKISADVTIHDINEELTKGSVRPLGVDYKVTGTYGPRGNAIVGERSIHKGLDMTSQSSSQNIYSITDGVVLDKGYERIGYGHYIVVRHNTFTALYAHLENESVSEVGDFIRTAEVIGKVSSTGVADNRHLHLEVLVNGKNVNPLIIIEKIEELNQRNIKRRALISPKVHAHE